MALEIDGLAVLCAIAETPEAFPAIRSDVTKAAHALVTKQLKAKTLDLPGLRAVRSALGPQPLALIVDGLKDAEAKALVIRLDKHHPDLKDGPAVAHRRHLMALAADLDPVAAPAAKAKPAKAPAKPKPAAKAAEPPVEVPAAAEPAPPARPTPAKARAPARGKTAPADALASAAMAARPPRRPRQQE
ncbi:hypothetical protein [Methylobacterium frigidaeris]|uniref:Uncharacterized protein n=1 Tax=Methylobacterium frigidaeris TaxID=2038277 RepID=A0AA37HE59_9HYPH|nr:hypothetical protein [Methylobacterium frigidaeris]PIK71541.1 hypothetical protein CS379_18760 [Methylobacterium frigidaeris]GJD64235.1 hypothetical protein MPEAHAMD_4413 [Methylobacterium frigidaeris]